MAKNWVQLQNEYSLISFLKTYGTEDNCREKLFSFRWPNGFRCSKCLHNQYYQLKTRKLFQCRKCRYQCSLTAETIFASYKLPLTTWFLAIYLTTQAKKGMSALSLRKWFDISVNAAFKVKQKLQHAMKDVDDRLVL